MPLLLHLSLFTSVFASASPPTLSGRVENELALLDVLTWRAGAAVERGLGACAAGACPPTLAAPGTSIAAAKTVVVEGELVTVAYTSSSPHAGDFVALYANSSDLSAKTLPLKWAFVDDPSYLASGAGSRRFQLANFRSLGGYTFGLLTSPSRGRSKSLSIANATLLALSTPAVTLAGDVLGPQRPRLTPGAGDGSTLRVTWTSGRDATSVPALTWGTTAGGPYPFRGAVVTAHLSNVSLCGPPANGVGYRDLGFTHTATIVLADAGATRPRRIYYVLSDAVSASHETRASVPPAAGSPAYPSSLIAFDDLGRGSYDDAQTYGEYGRPSVNTSHAIMQLLDADPDGFVAVWTTGDISYATGLLAVWDWWTFMVSPWSGRVAYALQGGNHEAGQRWLPGATAPDASSHFSSFDTNDAGGECGVVTQHVLPFPEGATPDAPWWAWATGPFVLVTLSSEHDFTTGSPQWRWLDATLAGISRDVSPWLLVGIHRPMYIDSTYVADSPAQRGRGPSTADVPVMDALQAHIEPLTMRHKVSVLLYGHNHAVQVLTPAYRNASVQASVPRTRADGSGVARLFDRPRASLHMVIGTGGAGFTRNCATAVQLPPPSWDERCFFQWGFARVKALSPTALQVDWIDSGTGVVEERIDLVQDLAQPWADAPVPAPTPAPAPVPTPAPTSAVAAAVGGTLGGLAAALALAALLWWRCSAAEAYRRLGGSATKAGQPLRPHGASTEERSALT